MVVGEREAQGIVEIARRFKYIRIALPLNEKAAVIGHIGNAEVDTIGIHDEVRVTVHLDLAERVIFIEVLVLDGARPTKGLEQPQGIEHKLLSCFGVQGYLSVGHRRSLLRLAW